MAFSRLNVIVYSLLRETICCCVQGRLVHVIQCSMVGWANKIWMVEINRVVTQFGLNWKMLAFLAGGWQLLSFIECERKKVISLGKESIIFYILCNFGINLDYTWSNLLNELIWTAGGRFTCLGDSMEICNLNSILKIACNIPFKSIEIVSSLAQNMAMNSVYVN